MKLIGAEELLNSEVKEKIPFDPSEKKPKRLKIGPYKVDLEGNIFLQREKGQVHEMYIEKSRLKEEDWIIHELTKDWFSYDTFIPAYLQALKNAKVRLQIKVSYTDYNET
jgi:hypothetical protein